MKRNQENPTYKIPELISEAGVASLKIEGFEQNL